MATHLGKSVDTLREALRPRAARDGQGEALATRAEAPGTPPNSEVMAPVGRAGLTPAGPDDLVRRVRVFADVAGLSDCVEPAPTSAAGFRLAARPEQGTSPPAQRRAWWLLAGISGQVEAEGLPPVSLDPAFIFWLADPADPSATAFWEVLACLGRARSPEDRPDVAGGSTNAAVEV